MGRMKERASKPIPRHHPDLPTRPNYYPEAGYSVVDNKVFDVMLSIEEKEAFTKLLNKVNAAYSTEAVERYLSELEQKVLK